MTKRLVYGRDIVWESGLEFVFVRLLEEYERDFTIMFLWVVTFPEAASLRLRQLKFSHRQREERSLCPWEQLLYANCTSLSAVYPPKHTPHFTVSYVIAFCTIYQHSHNFNIIPWPLADNYIYCPKVYPHDEPKYEVQHRCRVCGGAVTCTHGLKYFLYQATPVSVSSSKY